MLHLPTKNWPPKSQPTGCVLKGFQQHDSWWCGSGHLKSVHLWESRGSWKKKNFYSVNIQTRTHPWHKRPKCQGWSDAGVSWRVDHPFRESLILVAGDTPNVGVPGKARELSQTNNMRFVISCTGNAAGIESYILMNSTQLPFARTYTEDFRTYISFSGLQEHSVFFILYNMHVCVWRVKWAGIRKLDGWFYKGLHELI